MPGDRVTIGVRCVKKGRAFHPEISKEATPVTMPLDEIKAYHAAFGHVDENFHPNETFAVLFSWLAMKDHVGAAGPGLDDHSSVDFTKLREWCRALRRRAAGSASAGSARFRPCGSPPVRACVPGGGRRGRRTRQHSGAARTGAQVPLEHRPRVARGRSRAVGLGQAEEAVAIHTPLSSAGARFRGAPFELAP